MIKNKILTKVFGSTFQEGSQELIRTQCNVGDTLFLKREPQNGHDINAIAIHLRSGEKLGYVNSDWSRTLAPSIDSGHVYSTKIIGITGKGLDNVGCNITIEEIIVCPHCENTVCVCGEKDIGYGWDGNPASKPD